MVSTVCGKTCIFFIQDHIIISLGAMPPSILLVGLDPPPPPLSAPMFFCRLFQRQPYSSRWQRSLLSFSVVVLWDWASLKPRAFLMWGRRCLKAANALMAKPTWPLHKYRNGKVVFRAVLSEQEFVHQRVEVFNGPVTNAIDLHRFFTPKKKANVS